MSERTLSFIQGLSADISHNNAESNGWRIECVWFGLDMDSFRHILPFPIISDGNKGPEIAIDTMVDYIENQNHTFLGTPGFYTSPDIDPFDVRLKLKFHRVHIESHQNIGGRDVDDAMTVRRLLYQELDGMAEQELISDIGETSDEIPYLELTIDFSFLMHPIQRIILFPDDRPDEDWIQSRFVDFQLPCFLLTDQSADRNFGRWADVQFKLPRINLS
jgi:hypothetical protein